MAEKRKYGQYFTIDLIAEFMVALVTHKKTCKVLEPSCGKGVFLDALSKQGFCNLAAYEIDPSLGARYDFIQFRSFISVPTSETYDVVIGNPPYIRWKNIEPELKEELEHNDLWNSYFNSLCDYMFVFILKSIEHLSEHGELVFITTDYWMNTTHSAALRNYMCQHGYFAEIYHFKESPLFEKVTASFVVFRYIKDRRRMDSIHLYRYNKTRGLPTKMELAEKTCFDHLIIPHFKENKRWVLASQAIQDKLAGFETACLEHVCDLTNGTMPRIGDVCEIGNGMVSGLDAAFQLKDEGGLNSAERDALIDVVKAKDLEPYTNVGITKYIFIQENISEEHFKRKYPHFAAHFQPNVDKLKCRYNYNRDIPYWEFVFPRNQKLFEREEARIFVPCKERISNKCYFRFSYAPSGCYPTQDVTAIFRKRDCRESLEYILAYLNNERVFEWLTQNGVIKGAIVEFSEAPIASIPYRAIDWDSQEEVQLHDSITNEVRRYLDQPSEGRLCTINCLCNSLFDK